MTVNMEASERTLEVSKGSKFKEAFKYLGPGLITSALVLGPGSITLSTKIGAIFGVQLVWTLLLAVLLMMAFTEMSARIGLAAKGTFIETVKERWNYAAGLVIGFGSFLVTASFQAGNAIGTGLAIEAMTGMSSKLAIVLMTALAIGLLFLTSFYKILEKIMLGLVALMLVSFLITVVIVQPSIGDVFRGFIPSFPAGSIGLVIAMFATSFSVVGALYQSYLVKEKQLMPSESKAATREALFGIFLLGFISFLIMLTAATILLPAGIQVNSAGEMAGVLEPSFGSFATLVFMLGLLGASYSSMIGNATIGGGLLADGLGIGHKLSDLKVRLSIIAVILIGSGVALIFDGAPLNLIVFAQGVTIFVVPFIAIAILIIANSKTVMGNLRNGLWSNIFGVIGLLVLLYLAYSNFQNIFLT